MNPWFIIVPAGFLVFIAGYITYNQLVNLRPEREKKIAAGIPATEGIILGLIARVTGPVGTTPLLRELKGIKEPEKALEAILADLCKKGCIKQTDKTHHQATGRGRRVAKILMTRKGQTR